MKGKDAAHGRPAAQPAHELPHFSLATLLRRPTLPFRGRLDHHPQRSSPGVGEFFLQFPCDVDLFSAWWHRGPCRFREGRPATCRCVPPPARADGSITTASPSPPTTEQNARKGKATSLLRVDQPPVGHQDCLARVPVRATSSVRLGSARRHQAFGRGKPAALLWTRPGMMSSHPGRFGRMMGSIPPRLCVEGHVRRCPSAAATRVLYKGERPTLKRWCSGAIRNTQPGSVFSPTRRSLFPFPFYTLHTSSPKNKSQGIADPSLCRQRRNLASGLPTAAKARLLST